MIPDDKVAEIRERTDLVALVKDHVELKRSGSSYRGLCPFHSEKTPSFYVHPDRGFFHCFGCQASGDAIAFVMRLEGLSFVEALRTLAERSGVEISEVDGEAERAARKARAYHERMLAVVEAAAGFFLKMRQEHRLSEMARAELSNRNISEETASRFRLGYAPHGWDELALFLRERGFSPIDCEKVGLLVPRKSADGHYDRFRHRLMFPIADVHGRIVAFSGRALTPLPGDERPGTDPPAKYVNSPESPLYHKGDVLFGLHEARVELRRREYAILCEGNFDVLALSQAGFANVVAPLGTAFTAAQAKLLRRYVPTVVLIFDADNAGRKAVRAAQPLLAAAGLSAKVVTLPAGDDPDSFLRTRGPEVLERLIESAPGLIEHLIETAAFEAGADARGKAEAIEALGPVLASVDSPIEARVYVERVAQAFEMRDVEAVRQQLRRGVRASRNEKKRDVVQPESAPPRAKEAALPELECRIVGAFLDHPSLSSSNCAEKVQGLLTSADLRAILALTTRWAGSRGVDASAMLDELSKHPSREWLERRLAVQEFEDESSAKSFIERATAVLERDRAKQENTRLKRELLEARRSGDDVRAQELMRRMTELFQSVGRGGIQGTKR